MLSAAPPTASRARTGCQVMRARIRAPANCRTACPKDAQTSTTNSAASETHSAGCGVAEQPRGQPDADQAAEQQPAGGERAGDEALPVAGDGVGDHQDDQEPVEDVHVVASPLVEAGVRQVGGRGGDLGAGGEHVVGQLAQSTSTSHGRVQPRKSKSRAMMPAVKPHRIRSLSSPIRKPGPFQPEGCTHRDPVRRVEQLVDRHPVDGVHLGRVDDVDRRSPRATSPAPG